MRLSRAKSWVLILVKGFLKKIFILSLFRGRTKCSRNFNELTLALPRTTICSRFEFKSDRCCGGDGARATWPGRSQSLPLLSAAAALLPSRRRLPNPRPPGRRLDRLRSPAKYPTTSRSREREPSIRSSRLPARRGRLSPRRRGRSATNRKAQRTRKLHRRRRSSNHTADRRCPRISTCQGREAAPTKKQHKEKSTPTKRKRGDADAQKEARSPNRASGERGAAAPTPVKD
jgi:hypothetical protein